MNNFKLKHCGVLCDSLNNSIEYFKEKVGLVLVEHQYKENEYNVAYMGNGTDVFMEIVERPYSDKESNYYSGKGNIPYMGLETENIKAAFLDLKEKTKVAYDIIETPNMFEFGILDSIGNLIKIFEYKDNCILKDYKFSEDVADDQMVFHHVSMIGLGTDYGTLVKFYGEVLGFKLVYRFPENPEVVGGFAFLVDPFFNENEHSVMFEIVATTDYEKCERENIDFSHAGSDKREILFVEKIGLAYDHYCFTAKNAKEADDKVKAKGVLVDSDDAFNTTYAFGHYIGWFRDLSGNDIEIMSGMSKENIEKMLKGEIVTIYSI